MKQLDEQLDKKPTETAVKELAELRIRNLQAFDELQSFNDKGKFLNKHPLLSAKSEFSVLQKLLKTNPTEFLHRHKNVLDNIKRYKAYIRREDRMGQRAADKTNLEKYEEKDRMFRMVLEELQQ